MILLYLRCYPTCKGLISIYDSDSHIFDSSSNGVTSTGDIDVTDVSSQP